MLRWAVAAAFVVAAAIVLVRHLAVPLAREGAEPTGAATPWSADPESDAAHLLMCLLMLAMVLFPAAAAPDALRGVLIAMMVVYAGLLLMRIGHRHTAFGGSSGFRVPAVAYHLVAAGAMLWATAGHHHASAEAGADRLPVLPVVILAAVFVLDAVLMLIPRTRTLLWHRVSHPTGPPGALGAVPHVVMDLGMAYMLVAAVAG